MFNFRCVSVNVNLEYHNRKLVSFSCSKREHSYIKRTIFGRLIIKLSKMIKFNFKIVTFYKTVNMMSLEDQNSVYPEV